MYDLRPPHLYVLRDVLEDTDMLEVFLRLRKGLPAGTPTHVVKEEELPDLAVAENWGARYVHMGMPPPAEDPILYVGRSRWDGNWPERQAEIKERLPEAPLRLLHRLFGYDAFSYANPGRASLCPGNPGGVCRPAWRLHLGASCPHKCFYCPFTGVMTATANLKEYRVKLQELVEKNPWELCWLYDDDAEALALEPEYGGMQMLVEYFASTPDRYLTVHTKSANVDFLEHLDHRGHTILTWSLTGRTQSELMEGRTGTTEERIAAAAKVASWGYTARFKFKPIVPVVNWREELAEMIRLVFEQTRPDNLTLFTLAWMDYETLLRLADTSLIDPWALDAARDAVEELGSRSVRPFPHHVRKTIYEFVIDEVRKYDKEVPMALSTESGEMWEELGPRLGFTGSDYVCGCGPLVTPGLRRLTQDPWDVATPEKVTAE
jgi:hypothetical protein